MLPGEQLAPVWDHTGFPYFRQEMFTHKLTFRIILFLFFGKELSNYIKKNTLKAQRAVE